MNDLIAIASNLVTIAGGIISVIFFFFPHLQTKQSAPSSYSGISPYDRVVRFGFVFCIIVIVTGGISAYQLLYPTFVAWQHQSFFNQENIQPPTYSYSFPLTNQDKRWDTGQPYGKLGHCLFQNQGYSVDMTLDDHYYPCYLETPLKDFMFQVQMQIKSGDAGGIIFRDDKKRTDFYYLYLSTTGTYTLNYWANGTGSTVDKLMLGVSGDFYHDQVQKRVSVVTLLARGSDLSIYIDDKYVDHIDDNRRGSGRIALTAHKLLNDTEVLYKQVHVWTL